MSRSFPLTRRAFFRRAGAMGAAAMGPVSLPFIANAAQLVEETQAPSFTYNDGENNMTLEAGNTLVVAESGGTLDLGPAVLAPSTGGTGYTTGRLISLIVNEREIAPRSLWSLPNE